MLLLVFKLSSASPPQVREYRNIEIWRSGLELLFNSQFREADSSFHQAYDQWRRSFDRSPEFMSGGNHSFYPDKRQKHLYDSLFSRISHHLEKHQAEIHGSNAKYRAGILFIAGRSQFYLRNFDKALTSLHLASKILASDKGKEKEMRCNIYEAIGDVYEEIREYKTAIAYYKAIKGLHSESFGKDHHRMAVLYEKLGICYSHLVDEKFINYYNGDTCILVSTDYLNRAIDINDRLFGKPNIRSAINKFQIGLNYYYSFRFYDMMLPTVLPALEMLHIAREDIESTDPGNVKRGNCYNVMAVCFLSLRQTDSSLFYFRKAYTTQLLNRGPHHPMTVHAALNLAGHHMNYKTTEADSAEYYFQKAIEFSAPGFNPKNEYENPENGNVIDYNFYIKALTGKAERRKLKYREKGNRKDLEYALSTMLLAFEASKKHMQKEHFSAAYGDWSEKVSNVARQAFRMCIYMDSVLPGQGYLEQAFNFVEESRHFTTLAGLGINHSNHAGKVPPHLIKKQQEANQRFSSKRNELLNFLEKNDFQDYHEIIDLQQQFFEIRKEQHRIASLMSEYKSDDEADKVHVQIEDLQTGIDENTVLMQLFNDRHGVYEILVSKDDACFFTSDVDIFRIDSLISGLHSSITAEAFNSGQSVANYQRFINNSNSLYALIFNDDVLQFIGERQKLVIIPAGLFSYIPFEALIAKKPAGGTPEYKNLPYLIHNFEVHQIPTALHIAEWKDRRRGIKQYAGFAPEYNSAQLALLGKDFVNPYGTRSRSLGELVENKKEVMEVAKIIGGEVFVSENATEAAYKELAGTLDILHLAMHAVIDMENPLSSKLIFSQEYDEEDEDNLLNLYEIYGQNTPSDLVVLSACNTGYGQLIKGDGVMSLSRAFITSGVPSVVSTLWWADDRTSKEIIVDFFRSVHQEMSLSAALRSSKLDYLSNADSKYAHPYYWSHFVLVGNNTAFTFGNHFVYKNLWLFIVGMFFTGGGLFMVWVKRKCILNLIHRIY